MKFSWSPATTTDPLNLILTAEDSSFDPTTLQHWKDEGFQVTYLPFTSSRKEYVRKVQNMAEELRVGVGGKWVIVCRSEFLCDCPGGEVYAR